MTGLFCAKTIRSLPLDLATCQLSVNKTLKEKVTPKSASWVKLLTFQLAKFQLLKYMLSQEISLQSPKIDKGRQPFWNNCSAPRSVQTAKHDMISSTIFCSLKCVYTGGHGWSLTLPFWAGTRSQSNDGESKNVLVYLWAMRKQANTTRMCLLSSTATGRKQNGK